MEIVLAALCCILVVAAFRFSGVARMAGDVFTSVRETLAVMSDPERTDDEKEKRVQAASLYLFKRFFQITVIAALILLTPVFIIYPLDALDVVSLRKMTHLFTQPLFVLLTLAGFAGSALIRR